MLSAENGWTQGYAFTITLKPHVRKMTCEEQYDKYTSYVTKTLESFYPNCLYTMVAEMTKSYDLHFHGIIKFKINNRIKNLSKYFHDSFRGDKIIGYVLLKVMDDDKGWKTYLGKALEEFRASTGREPIIKEFFTLSE